MSLKWLERNFGPHSKTAEKAEDDFRLLLFDGHTSHVNTSFLTYCLNNRVIPFCLPPHTTHKLQPLDVCIFSPYKRYYRRELELRFTNKEYGVGKHNFYQIISVARREAFTPENIRSSFWWTGLCPLDSSIILRQLDWQTNNNNEHTLPPRPSTPLPRNRAEVLAINPERIAVTSTPINRSSIVHMRRTIENSTASNSPYSWRIRHYSVKGFNAAERIFIENEYLKDEVKNLKKQLDDCKKKKKSPKNKDP
jgi:hypothetical protein